LDIWFLESAVVELLWYVTLLPEHSFCFPSAPISVSRHHIVARVLVVQVQVMVHLVVGVAVMLSKGVDSTGGTIVTCSVLLVVRSAV
jgi:hypothetical protein